MVSLPSPPARVSSDDPPVSLSLPRFPFAVIASTPEWVRSAPWSPFTLTPADRKVILSAPFPPSITRASLPALRLTVNSISEVPADSIVAPGANCPSDRSSLSVSFCTVPVTFTLSMLLTEAPPQLGSSMSLPVTLKLDPERTALTVSPAAMWIANSVPLLPQLEDPNSGSQASPKPSLSASACPGLETSGQLSVPLGTPSPSRSESQASPIPSPSASAWPGLEVSGQLSLLLGFRHYLNR
jgi:hypothetical protein